MDCNYVRLLAAASFALSAAGAAAEDIHVMLLDSAADGPLAFSPAFVKASVGDTLVFAAGSAGHNSASLLVPNGAAAWRGPFDKEFRVKLEQQGVYLYGCESHKRMGMVGVVQVGNAVNLAEARKKADEESAQFLMNKDRFAKALAQVH